MMLNQKYENLRNNDACYLSIIIPVYNAANYLEDCINSILCQTYRNFEILLIDDGSTDGSAEICDRYVQLDNRIKCLHQENSGPSKARNMGFRNATGKYIYCIDNDDKILKDNFFSEVVSFLSGNEVDVVLTGATYYKAATKEIKKAVDYSQFTDINKLAPKQMITMLIRNHAMQISCWTRFIRRDFLEKNALYFDESLIVEDLEWNLRMWPAIGSMQVFQRADYCHIYREGSIASGDSPRNIKCREDQITTIKSGIELLEKETSDRQFTEAVLTYLNYQFFIALYSIAMLKGEQKFTLIRELIKYDQITKYNLDNQVKLLSHIYRFFGVRGALFCMKLYSFFLRPTTKKSLFGKRTSKVLTDGQENA